MYRVFSGKEKHQDHSAANAKKQRNTENKKTLDRLAQEDSDKQDKLLEQDQLEQDQLEQKRLKQERLEQERLEQEHQWPPDLSQQVLCVKVTCVV